jgi:LCP family protein required for cell wall assembly
MNTKKTNPFLIFLLGLGVMGTLVLAVISVKAFRQPLGPALVGITETPAAVINMDFLKTQMSNTQIAQPAVATNTQSTSCGETTAWNILILGSDAGELRYKKGSDFTRVLRVDFANQKAAVFAFSRDLWVDTSGLGLANPTINETSLGTVFYEARSRSAKTNSKDSAVDGTKITALMLSKNFSIHTDHYLTVDLAQIPGMVDTLGGISINIPQQTTDPWIGMVIPAGQQTLTGAQFVAYARAIPDSDFGRIQRNNLLIDALREKLLSPAVWIKIPQLYIQYKDVIATDLSPEQINNLTCLLKEIPKEAIIQDQVKPEWTSRAPQQGALLWDKSLVVNRLKELGLAQ